MGNNDANLSGIKAAEQEMETLMANTFNNELMTADSKFIRKQYSGNELQRHLTSFSEAAAPLARRMETEVKTLTHMHRLKTA